MAGGVNLYGYAGSNPITFSDPFGLSPCLAGPIALRTCAAIAVAIGSAAGSAFHQAYTNYRAGKPLMQGTASAAIDGGRDGAISVLIGEGIGAVAGRLATGAAKSPSIHPSEVANRTPSQIDALAKERGLIPKGPAPASGRGAYIDPVTGEQRLLCHVNACEPHAHVNNAAGQRLDLTGNVVAPESQAAHLPIRAE